MIRKAFAPVALLVMAAIASASCGPGAPAGEQRGVSEGMAFSVTADSLPPHASDRTTWRITMRDAKSGAPIEGGEGQIWGKNKDGHKAGEGFAIGKESGTYLGRVDYVTAGSWEMTVRFRRDSLSPFGQLNWMQEVRGPRPIGG